MEADPLNRAHKIGEEAKNTASITFLFILRSPPSNQNRTLSRQTTFEFDVFHSFRTHELHKYEKQFLKSSNQLDEFVLMETLLKRIIDYSLKYYSLT